MAAGKAVIVLAIVVAAVVSLSFAGYIMRPTMRVSTWEEAVEAAQLVRGGRVRLAASVRPSFDEQEVAVGGRRAIVTVLRLCGFGNLTPTLSLNGWLLERGPEGDACITSVPVLSGGYVSYYAPDPDPSRVPNATRTLTFVAVARQVVVYVGGEYREYTVVERRLSMCPCRRD